MLYYFFVLELGAATAAGRIAEFAKMGWDPAVVPDPQAASTFIESKLDWTEPTDGWHAELLDLYRDLLRLRRAMPELTDPRLTRISCEIDEEARWIIVHRGGVDIAVNFSSTAVSLATPGELVLATDDRVVLDDAPSGGRAVTMPGHSAAIIRR